MQKNDGVLANPPRMYPMVMSLKIEFLKVWAVLVWSYTRRDSSASRTSLQATSTFHLAVSFSAGSKSNKNDIYELFMKLDDYCTNSGKQ